MIAEGIARLTSLRGRTALVTGAAGGIGRAVSRTLMEAGAEVVGVDLPDRELEPGTTALPCDVADEGAIASLLGRLRSDAVSPDVFVHCAGVSDDAVLWKMTPDAWRRVLAVNLDAAFHLLRGLVPGMRAKGGGIVVLVSSINGERGKFGQANYAAAKAGLLGLGRTAARELGAFNVRVNVIAPGMIETDMTAGLPEEIVEQARSESALNRIGSPENVAHATLFLCSEMSAHVTGQVLRVDGGQLTA